MHITQESEFIQKSIHLVTKYFVLKIQVHAVSSIFGRMKQPQPVAGVVGKGKCETY
jgi:hypothetical protein